MTESNAPTLLLVLGAPGSEEYGNRFAAQARRWRDVGARAGARLLQVGWEPTNTPANVPADAPAPAPTLSSTKPSANNPTQASPSAPPETATEAPTDRDTLRRALEAEPVDGDYRLWVVLIGHGTDDGHAARFNLRGPDVTAPELAGWLQPIRRPIVVINTTAASAPFLAALAATHRIVITATRSGQEDSYARFGDYLAETIADPASDLDQDGQTSLLESFLMASRRVAEFYQTAGRLATEHALLDDNGDGLGTSADWFRGVRAVKQPQAGAARDGIAAHQIHLILSPAEQALSPALRARRDALEREVFRLRESKATLAEDEYYRRLEALLLDLARLVSGNK